MSLKHPLRGAQHFKHDLIQMMMGGGSDQPIIPHFGGNQGPTQKQVYSGMRQGITSFSGADSLAAFHDRPGLGTGVSAAISLPFPAMRTAGLVAGGERGYKEAKMLKILHDRANAEQLIAFGQGHNLDNVHAMLAKAPEYVGQKVARGRLYRLPPEAVRRPRHAFEISAAEHTAGINPRMPVIQDPKTGALFAAPVSWENDFHHGELAAAVDKIHYMKHNPEYAFDATSKFQIPNAFGNGHHDWMQHEIISAQTHGKPMKGLKNVKDVLSNVTPGRVNFTGHSNIPLEHIDPRDPVKDTRSATIGRMRLLRDLKAVGHKGTMVNPEGTTALTRVMRTKYGNPASTYRGSH